MTSHELGLQGEQGSEETPRGTQGRCRQPVGSELRSSCARDVMYLRHVGGGAWMWGERAYEQGSGGIRGGQ